jgi:hypothetical protein
MIAYSITPRSKGYPDDKWDFGFLKEAFDKKNVEVIKVKHIPETDRAFVIAPGFEWHGLEETLSYELNKIRRVVLFITADELGVFNFEKITHPNIEIWVQYPYAWHEQYNKMPLGVPEHLKRNLPEYPTKTYDSYFSGQVTHPRREQLAKAIVRVPNSVHNFTAGFTQGETPQEYYRLMSNAKIAPAPAGSATIDSFRFYEAIEMLCIPIADRVSSRGEAYGFWEILFKSMPVKQVSDWSEMKKLIPSLLNNYPHNMHKIVSWWIKQKRDFANKIMEQIDEH